MHGIIKCNTLLGLRNKPVLRYIKAITAAITPTVLLTLVLSKHYANYRLCTVYSQLLNPA